MLRDLLRGLEACPPQSVGNMVVVPIIGAETEFRNVGHVGDVQLREDVSYESMRFGTDSRHVTIVPQGLVCLTKESAQDRVLPSAHLLQGKEGKQLHTFCVQSSQCGLMRKDREEERQFRLLPASLRLKAYRNRDTAGYSALWEDLRAFNTSTGATERGSQGEDFLVNFFRKFDEQIAEFVAEFEPVEGQRGAIVLVNGSVVGVEVMPNRETFLDMWQYLIRDCYGSEALARIDKAKPERAFVLEDVGDLDQLVGAVDRLAEKEQAWAEEVAESVLSEGVELQSAEAEGAFSLHNVDMPGYDGQLVKKEEDTIFLSLLAKEAGRRGFRRATRTSRN